MRRLSDAKIRKAAITLASHGTTEVYIFGSYAERRARSDSDVDFAVSGLPPQKYFAAMGQVVEELGRGIDLINLDRKNSLGELLKRRGDLVRLV